MKITMQVTIQQNEDDDAWQVEDNVAEATGISETIMGAFEEWFYGFTFAVQESPPVKPTSDFIAIRAVYNEEIS